MINNIYNILEFVTPTVESNNFFEIANLILSVIGVLGAIGVPIYIFKEGIKAYKAQKKIDSKSKFFDEKVKIYTELNKILLFLQDKRTFEYCSKDYREFFFKNKIVSSKDDFYNNLDAVIYKPLRFDTTANVYKTINSLYDFYRINGLYLSENVNRELFNLIQTLFLFYGFHNIFISKASLIYMEENNFKNTRKVKKKKDELEGESYHFAYYFIEKTISNSVNKLGKFIIEELDNPEYDLNKKFRYPQTFNIDEIEMFYKNLSDEDWFDNYIKMYDIFIQNKLSKNAYEKFDDFVNENFEKWGILRKNVDEHFNKE